MQGICVLNIIQGGGYDVGLTVTARTDGSGTGGCASCRCCGCVGSTFKRRMLPGGIHTYIYVYLYVYVYLYPYMCVYLDYDGDQGRSWGSTRNL